MFDKQQRLCLNFLEKVKENRQNIFSDVEKTNPDLYFALRTKINSAKQDVYLRLYDLSWFQNLWASTQPLFEKKDLSYSEKQKLVDWYDKFLKLWEFSCFGKTLISEEKRILDDMLSMNEKWEENVKRMEDKFLKMKVELDKKLEHLKAEEE